MAKQSNQSSYAKNWEPSQTQRFDDILGRDISNLLRESSTEFNFLEVKEKLNNIRGAVQLISQNYDFWTELSEGKRNNINSALDDVIAQFTEMESFDPKTSSPWESRNQIVQNFINRYNGFYEYVMTPLNAYLGKKAFSQELTSKFGKEAQSELAEIRRVKTEIERVQKTVSDAAAVASDVASAAYTTSFANQSKEHEKSATNWLWAVVAATCIALIIVILVVIDIVKNLGGGVSTLTPESAAIKVVILGFLFYAIRFTTKNYSAHKHLAIVNQHRSNVLQSMEAFRISTPDEPTKDAILLSAVSAAYALQETGFITTKEGAGSNDSEILKVIDSTINKRN
jgi:hypothetical protein